MDRQDSKKESLNPASAGPQALVPWLGFSARVLLGLLFVVSGTLKASSAPEEFALVIDSYGLVPSADVVLLLATFLPWVEVILGFALLFGFQTRLASATLGTMLLGFFAAILSTKLRGIELPNCGCFGFGFHPTPNQEMGFNVFWCALAIQAYRAGSERLSLDNWCASGYN
jgi:uncharacterized membrane protein YphA (DoxX/SURF4 family)